MTQCDCVDVHTVNRSASQFLTKADSLKQRVRFDSSFAPTFKIHKKNLKSQFSLRSPHKSFLELLVTFIFTARPLRVPYSTGIQILPCGIHTVAPTTRR